MRWKPLFRLRRTQRSIAAAFLGMIGTATASAYSGEVLRQMADVDGQRLQVFSYRPKGCASPAILMIFHGNSRTAESYLEAAIPLADRGCFALYAPLFDRDRFPSWAYHRGGVAEDGRLRSEEDWTVDMVDDLLTWARQQEGRPDAPGYLFGHSAGGQFLSRVAAYGMPAGVRRVILANPSTYVLPTRNEDAPYGYGGLAEDEETTGWMRDYLAAPITIYLGERDTGDEDLTMTDAAIRQGRNRLERGELTFAKARDIAKERGWSFNWTLVEARDVGHSARGMLQAEEMTEALGF
ncbi:Alpha/beta hydrolase family protein [Paracoccus halophilus]|uniref:Alpha/beta hydrolase family protein n=1 Tax=Paracoccus halophilus TaxID=376733 RepID=A0A1I0SXI3_9RHOB|nr:alpha/beta fold hydrolase [Paracoccus halophilus]SFA44117.1 Alpha/beta hydrolase family protein [Paracoccus halophilus]